MLKKVVRKKIPNHEFNHGYSHQKRELSLSRLRPSGLFATHLPTLAPSHLLFTFLLALVGLHVLRDILGNLLLVLGELVLLALALVHEVISFVLVHSPDHLVTLSHPHEASWFLSHSFILPFHSFPFSLSSTASFPLTLHCSAFLTLLRLELSFGPLAGRLGFPPELRTFRRFLCLMHVFSCFRCRFLLSLCLASGRFGRAGSSCFAPGLGNEACHTGSAKHEFNLWEYAS